MQKNNLTNELQEMLNENNQKKLCAFYDIYSARLYGLILKNIANAETANDILLKVFMHLYKELKNKTSFKQGPFIFLYTSAKKLIAEQQFVQVK